VEQLLLIDIVRAHGIVILQTIWGVETAGGREARRTDVESIKDRATLIARLRELDLGARFFPAPAEVIAEAA